jgi:plastocyanin
MDRIVLSLIQRSLFSIATAMKHRNSFLGCALSALALVAACSSPPPPAPPAATGTRVDPATAGTITGKVMFTGTPPPVETLKMTTDRACVQQAGPNPASDAVLIAADGALQNVFVYVKDGLAADYAFDVPTTPVVLDQKGCRYTPRILGIRVGQTMEIINSDATLHNVHALPNANQEFNQSAPVQGFKVTRTFTVPEVMVRFMCNVHGWMTAHLGVMTHPFFAVTAPDGSFELKGLPPGTYTIGAWHEKFGAQTSQVTIAPSQSQSVSFTFKAN